MSQQLKLISQCMEYLEEQGYYGDYSLMSTAEELCERFATKDGGEVDEDTYLVIKEWLG